MNTTNQEIKDIKYNIFSSLDEIQDRIDRFDPLTEEGECFYVSYDIDTYEINIESSFTWKLPNLENMEACFYIQKFGQKFDSIDFNFIGIETLVNHYN